jgi:tetratricopeptide (TPR) repeat protein
MKLDGNHPNVKSNLATACHSIRRFEDAVILYKQAVELESRNVILLANYAILLCDAALGQADEGLQLIAKAEQIDLCNVDVQRAGSVCGLALVEIEDMNSSTMNVVNNVPEL